MLNRDIYDRIAKRIIEALDKGVAPWHCPLSKDGRPNQNLISKKPYRGINALLLALRGLSEFGSPFWLTFKQAKELGGHVKKGAHGTEIVFWNFRDRRETDAATGEVTTKRSALIRTYTVFNVEQCELPADAIPTSPDIEQNAESRIAGADAIVQGYLDNGGPVLRETGDRACYSPALDIVYLPPFLRFESAADYYSSTFHELVHSTGHSRRLAREGIVNTDGFGNHLYSKEELVAESGAAFLCGHVGLLDRTLDNSAAYLRSWRAKLAENPEWIIQAIGQAQRAVDHILGVKYEGEASSESNTNTTVEQGVLT